MVKEGERGHEHIDWQYKKPSDSEVVLNFSKCINPTKILNKNTDYMTAILDVSLIFLKFCK